MDLEPTVTANDDPEHRAGYLMYSVEFGLRGLWPVDEITTHGPHHPEDFVWGDGGRTGNDHDGNLDIRRDKSPVQKGSAGFPWGRSHRRQRS